MHALLAAVGTNIQPTVAFCDARFSCPQHDVLAVSLTIPWNLQRDSDSLSLRTYGCWDWNFDQDGRTHV